MLCYAILSRQENEKDMVSALTVHRSPIQNYRCSYSTELFLLTFHILLWNIFTHTVSATSNSKKPPIQMLSSNFLLNIGTLISYSLSYIPFYMFPRYFKLNLSPNELIPTMHSFPNQPLWFPVWGLAVNQTKNLKSHS